VKILVISLPTSQDRRKKVVEKLGSKNIEFEFLDAIDGRTDDHPYLKNYNEKLFLLNRRRKVAPGELGCYVSHLLAWEKCVALNMPVIVLEDDFELTEGFVDGLQFVEKFTDAVGFIRLEPVESNFFLHTCKGEKFSLIKQIKVGMCLTGYVINPRTAKALLETGKEICAPIDLYIRQTCIHKQLIHALIPHIVYPTHADSTIGFDIRQIRKKGVVLKIRRFIHKWHTSIGSIVVNLVNACTKF
jgi:glycosyl transferase, family 25